MNAAPYPADVVAPAEGAAARPVARRSRPWIGSFTVICFLFGGLMAMQLRSSQRLKRQSAELASRQMADQAQLVRIQEEAKQGKASVGKMQGEIAELTRRLKTSVGKAEMQKVLAQLHELQMIAGLTPVTGEGVRIMLTDSPDADKVGAGSATALVPGIVHDFDLLQIVNELRATGAEAIAVNGIRITGYTPIRCVGPVIHINGQPQAPPFRIEAVGDPDRLSTGLRMAGGILQQLKNQAMLGVQITTSDSLRLPASESMPKLRAAKAQVTLPTAAKPGATSEP